MVISKSSEVEQAFCEDQSSHSTLKRKAYYMSFLHSFYLFVIILEYKLDIRYWTDALGLHVYS